MNVKNIDTKTAAATAEWGWFLADALLEVRELVPSGGLAMHIIDEALVKVGLSPGWKARHPECSGRGTVHTLDEVCDHCRLCGEWRPYSDGLCKLCLKCSLCCEDSRCPIEGEWESPIEGEWEMIPDDDNDDNNDDKEESI